MIIMWNLTGHDIAEESRGHHLCNHIISVISQPSGYTNSFIIVIMVVQKVLLPYHLNGCRPNRHHSKTAPVKTAPIWRKRNIELAKTAPCLGENGPKSISENGTMAWWKRHHGIAKTAPNLYLRIVINWLSFLHYFYILYCFIYTNIVEIMYNPLLPVGLLQL